MFDSTGKHSGAYMYYSAHSGFKNFETISKDNDLFIHLQVDVFREVKGRSNQSITEAI